MNDTFFGIPDKYVDRYTANYGPDGKGGLKQIEDSDGGRQLVLHPLKNGPQQQKQ